MLMIQYMYFNIRGILIPGSKCKCICYIQSFRWCP